MLSYQAMGLRQRTQWERGLTTLRLRGQRWMHTLRKLPMRRPKRSAMRASIMELPDHVRQAGSPLMGTLLVRHHVTPATRVETSLDTAGTRACAPRGSRPAGLRRGALTSGGGLLVRHHVTPATRVETSLDTAGTSACATCGSRLADLSRVA